MSLAVIHHREWNAGCETYHEDSVTNFSCRHCIDLGGDGFLDAAAIEGGEPSEKLRNLTRGFGGNIGAKTDFAALDAELGFQGSWPGKKEWKLRQPAETSSISVKPRL